MDPTNFKEWHFIQEYVDKDIIYTNQGLGTFPNNVYKLLWDTVLPYVENFRNCIDIGSYYGQFSRYATQKFEMTYCFDPIAPMEFTYNVPQDKVTHYTTKLDASTKLDDFDISNVDMIKICVKSGRDFEEHLILSGAENTLKNNNPVVLVDINQSDIDNRAETYLTDLKYSHVATFGNIKIFKK